MNDNKICWNLNNLSLYLFKKDMEHKFKKYYKQSNENKKKYETKITK